MDLLRLKRVYVAFFLLVVAIVVGAGACGFDPQIADGAFACAADRSCPNGMVCAGDNKCYRPGNGPPVPTIDGGQPDSTPPVVISRLQADPLSLSEGNSSVPTDFVFTVRLDPPSAKEVTVDYATNDGTAKTGEDYAAASGKLVFPPGSASQTVTVKVIADRFEEPDEAFKLTLSNPVNAEFLPGAGPEIVATIKNDDSPGLAVDDISITEGDTDTTATFTVSLSGTYTTDVTLNFSTQEGTATKDSDFIATADTLVFAPGEKQKTITVPIKGDLAHEPEETFFVVLANVVGAPVVDGEALAKIADNDPIPSLSIADATIAEGDTGTANMAFPVTLSAASGEEIKVSYTTTAGVAGTSDYSTTSGTLVFPPGTTTQTISVPISGDLIDEVDETFTVALSAAVNATVLDATATGTIIDDDDAPVLTVEDVALAEGNAGATTFAFVLNLSTPSAKTITVTYATANGTATAGVDYTAATNTVTFAAGEVTKTVNVLVAGDTAGEPSETFSFNLTNPTNVTLARTSALGTIVNDDGAAATFSIDDPPAIAEGNASTKTVTFTVTCTAAVGTVSNASVQYATANLTATSGSDYVATPVTPPTLTFGTCTTGGTTQTFTVTINGDTTYEPDETFAVNLSNPSADTAIVKSQGIATITNDDVKPTISIAGVSASEGNAGTKTFSFDVSLSNAASTTVTVNYATAAGTALAGTDYVTTSGTLSFAPGETTKAVSVTVNGDLVFEPDETFNVNLSGNSTANSDLPANTSALGTITNDDTQPTVSIDDISVAEGNSGNTNFVFTVTLSGPSSQTITVDYATSDATAAAPGDYAAKTGTVTFTPGGSLTQTITIVGVGDTVNEANETFNVTLSNPVNTTIETSGGANVGVGTILNDDTARAISINNAQGTEGNNVTFTVTMSATSMQKVTVSWTLSHVTTSANDVSGSLSGTVDFNPGQTSKTIQISTQGDSLDEVDETFEITLSNVVGNATIFNGVGTGTILDNDAPPTLSITSSVQLDEGDAGTKAFTFNVTLSAASGRVITVEYDTQDVSTTSGGSPSQRDYTSESGTLTWNPGDPLTKTITVLVNGDTTVEEDETFEVVLSNAVNATLPATPKGTGRIQNDD